MPIKKPLVTLDVGHRRALRGEEDQILAPVVVAVDHHQLALVQRHHLSVKTLLRPAPRLLPRSLDAERRPDVPPLTRNGAGELVPPPLRTLPGKPGKPTTPGSRPPPVFTLGDRPPLHLVASVLLAPGQSDSPNEDALRAPEGMAMVVEEILFSIDYLIADNPDYIPGWPLNPALLIACSLSLDGEKIDGVARYQEPITAGVVPVGLFGPAQLASAEWLSLGEGSDSCGQSSHFAWRPKVPILVPAGAILKPTFENRGFTSFSARVRVGYSGHAIRSGAPAYPTQLPFIAAWSPAAFTPSGVEVEADTSEKDFANPFDAPLEVDFLMARAAGVYQDPAAVRPVTVTEDSASAPAYWRIAAQTQLKLGTSWGTKVVRDWTPLAAVFDPWTRMLRAPFTMPARAFLSLQVKCGSEVMADTQVLTGFAMAATREVMR